MQHYSCDDIRKFISNGAYLVDVRTRNEHVKNALPNSINIPLSILPTIADEHFKDEEVILVYCQGGGRAIIAEKILKNMGYTNIQCIGGIAKYQHCH